MDNMELLRDLVSTMNMPADDARSGPSIFPWRFKQEIYPRYSTALPDISPQFLPDTISGGNWLRPLASA